MGSPEESADAHLKLDTMWNRVGLKQGSSGWKPELKGIRLYSETTAAVGSGGVRVIELNEIEK